MPPVTGPRGSTLLVFPAALLVVVVLAAVTVDLARIHLAQRAVTDAAAAGANDAATAGLDLAALRRTGAYRIDPARAARVAERTVAGHGLTGVDAVSVRTTLTGPAEVRVSVSARVPPGFAAALPGWAGRSTVTGRATAGVVVR